LQFARGAQAEGQAYLTEALAVRRTVLGEEHPLTCETRASLIPRV